MNNDQLVTASDALLVLNEAVGIDANLQCSGPTEPPPAPFRIVVIPDTQRAVLFQSGQLEAQIDWIIETKPDYVAQVGDIVENAWVDAEWEYASQQFYRLDAAGVPYGLAVGNHDQNENADPTEGSTEQYRAFFGPERYSDEPHYAAFHERGDSHAALVGSQLLVLFIEFGDGDSPDLLLWARSLISSHPDRVVAIVSHYTTSPSGEFLARDGIYITDHLSDLPNVAFVFSGHVHRYSDGAEPGDNYGVETRTLWNRTGRGLWFLTANWQSDGNQGSGWLRIYDIDTQARTLTAQTYSPWLDEYDRDDESEFSIDW